MESLSSDLRIFCFSVVIINVRVTNEFCLITNTDKNLAENYAC